MQKIVKRKDSAQKNFLSKKYENGIFTRMYLERFGMSGNVHKLTHLNYH